MALGFWNFAKQDPKALALVTPEEKLVSRGELAAASNRLARGLRAQGLVAGDAVAVVLENGQPFVELYLACFQAGLYLVPINNHLAGPEIAYIVENSEAKVFVTSPRFRDAVEKALPELKVPADAALLRRRAARLPPLRRALGRPERRRRSTTAAPAP